MPTSKSIVAELVDKRTLNSKHYLLSDGSYQAVISMVQIHFDDGDGNLHNINTDLFDEADFHNFNGPVNKHGKQIFSDIKQKVIDARAKGTLNRDLFDYQGLQVPFECKIPRNFKRGYTIGKGADKLTFTPVGASPAKGYVEVDATNSIHYQDAWNDADVILELTDKGLKETITLKTDRAPSSFSFEVDGNLADDLTAGGLKLQPAWLEDANGTKRDVTQTVRTDSTTGTKYVDMTADISGLAYPIVIDPTIAVQPDGTTGKDTFINSGGPTANYGTNTTSLIVGLVGANQVLIQFDISSIPILSSVISATLDMYEWGSNGSATIVTTTHPITSSWDANTVTYNTKPSFDTSTSGGSLSVPTNGSKGTRTYEIKNIAQYWLNQVNYGLVIMQTDTGNASATFYPSEYSTVSYRPRLTISYSTPPTAPTVTSPNGGESWNSQETVTYQASTEQNVLQPLSENTSAFIITTADTMSTIQQTFKVDKNIPIKAIYLHMSTSNGSPVDMYLKNTDASGIPYLVQDSKSSIPTPTHTSGEDWVGFNLATPTAYAVGTELAISVARPSGIDSYYSFYTNSSYADGATFYDGTAQPRDLVFKVEYETTSDNLQYQIQLSTDNGTNWKDIVALTAAGVVSYPYDFINETESSTCLIRVRAYDGSSYGPWDQSDGVFTIQHNQAPTAPTNLSPSGGASKDRATVIRYSWQHNDPNSGDPQSQFDLQWRPKGTQTWNTVSQSTPNQYYDMPANTLSHGDIEWQVRTYDQAGLSGPYSALQTFLAGDKPATPTITSPTDGATVAVANPTVQWSSSGQTGFTVSVKDSTGTQVYSATGTTNKAQTIQYDLANQSNYTIDVTITNSDNLPSDPDSVGITVSYTPPAQPILSTSVDSGRGSITVNIDNPVPSGTEPNVSYNDIYRRKQGDTDFIRIDTNIPSSGYFVDFTPAYDQIYEYYVRAYGDNGTFSDSQTSSSSATFKDAQLALVSDFNQFVQLMYNPSRSYQHTIKRTMMEFAGREDPVPEFGIQDNLDMTLSFKITDDSDLTMLRTLAYSRDILLYRDSRGRREFVTLDGLTEKDVQPLYYEVSFNPTRSSYDEKV